MVPTIASNPATAQPTWRSTKWYGDPNFSFATTAEALNTITSPTNTSSSVTVNNVLSTLPLFAPPAPHRRWYAPDRLDEPRPPFEISPAGRPRRSPFFGSHHLFFPQPSFAA